MSSPQISSGWMFSTFCVLLRMTEGVGSAMFFTAAFAVLPELFPNHVGTVMVGHVVAINFLYRLIANVGLVIRMLLSHWILHMHSSIKTELVYKAADQNSTETGEAIVCVFIVMGRVSLPFAMTIMVSLGSV